MAAEALAAKLAHPNTPPLLDSGDAAGTRSARPERNESSRSDLPTEMHAGFAQLCTEIADLRAELIKWMLLFWLGTVAALIFTR